MTDEEIERFALVLKECERIRALIARRRPCCPTASTTTGYRYPLRRQSNGRPGSRGPPTPERTVPRSVLQRARKEPGEFAESRRTRRSIRWILREAEGKKSYAEKLRSVLRPTLLGWTP